MKLPEEILEAASRKMEKDGVSLSKLHPSYEEQKEEERKAYGIMQNKLTLQEIGVIESAFGIDGGIWFDVAYVAGFIDGVTTGKALSGDV